MDKSGTEEQDENNKDSEDDDESEQVGLAEGLLLPDSDVVGLWLFEGSDYPHTTLTDASQDAKADLCLMDVEASVLAAASSCRRRPAEDNLGGHTPALRLEIARIYKPRQQRSIGSTENTATAEGGSRTLTLLPGRDFESRASASSATSAKPRRRGIIHGSQCLVKRKFSAALNAPEK